MSATTACGSIPRIAIGTDARTEIMIPAVMPVNPEYPANVVIRNTALKNKNANEISFFLPIFFASTFTGT